LTLNRKTFEKSQENQGTFLILLAVFDIIIESVY